MEFMVGFLDTGSLWGLDNTDSGRIDDSSEIRSALGFFYILGICYWSITV